MFDLRYATHKDYNFLYELNKITMLKYIEKIWGWEENIQQKFFGDKFSPEKYKIIVYDDVDIGVVAVSTNDNSIFIEIIEILPEYQSKGIGTEIISKIIADSKNKNCSRVWLQVFKMNPAKKLYDRLGFLTKSETETHYIMELNLK